MRDDPAGAVSGWKTYLVAGLFSLAVALPFLGGPPLFDPDEGYYPATAQEMLERGDWLDPVFNGEPRWGKPVGFYLADVLSFELFGQSEWAARLPSVLAGLALVLATVGLAGRLHGPRAALYAGLAAATALQSAVYHRAAVPDMLLAAGVALSLLGYVFRWTASREGEDRGWFLLLYGGAGLAFLAKGPLGAGLPGLVALLHLLSTRRLGELGRYRLLSGTALFLLIVAPWYGWMTWRHGSAFLEESLLQQNVLRYATNRWEHSGPLWYYLPVLLAGAFPWTAAFLRGAWLSGRAALGRGEGNPAVERFVLAWLAGMLIFFSLSRSKLPNYVLPLYPAVALLAGLALARLERAGSRRQAWGLALPTALLAALLYAGGGFFLAGRLQLAPGVVLAALSPLGLIAMMSLALPLGRFPGGTRGWALALAGSMALLLALASGLAIPRVEQLQAVRLLAREHLADPRERPSPVVAYRVWAPSLLFYSSRTAIRFDPERDNWEALRAQGGCWVLTRRKHLEELRQAVEGRVELAHGSGDRVLVRLGPSLAARGTGR